MKHIFFFIQLILLPFSLFAQINVTIKNQYAVIINGGKDIQGNSESYWNDCAFIYSTLVNVYHYDKSNIYVLMSDGTDPAIDREQINGTYDSSPLDLDGDGSPDIQYAATRANISSVFYTLSKKVTNEDHLFIFVTDHGNWHVGSQNVYLYLWGETMEDWEFALKVNGVNAKTINIVMGQCHSGGFINDFWRNNQIIATSCAADQSSFSTQTNQDTYSNAFLYHWTSAVAGKTPLGTIVNADYNNDGFVSMQEAFIYANGKMTAGNPQFSSNPTILADDLTLSGLISECISNIPNRPISTNTTIFGCDTLNIQDVKITSGVTVEITAGEVVTLGHGFHAVEGSDVTIRIETVGRGTINCLGVSTNDELAGAVDIQEYENHDSGNDFQEESKNFSFSIFPNPASGFVTVDYTLHVDAPICIELYNMFGQRIKLILPQQNQKSGNYSVQTSVADLGTGTYYIRVSSGSQIESKQLIINH